MAQRWKERHLYQIQKIVKVSRMGSRSRREQVMWTRLRSGQCKPNRTLMMVEKYDTGLFEGCQEEEMVEHVIQMRRYEAQRQAMRNKVKRVKLVTWVVDDLTHRPQYVCL